LGAEGATALIGQGVRELEAGAWRAGGMRCQAVRNSGKEGPMPPPLPIPWGYLIGLAVIVLGACGALLYLLVR